MGASRCGQPVFLKIPRAITLISHFSSILIMVEKGGRHYRACFYGLPSEIGNQPYMKVFGLDKMPEHGVDIEMHQPRG